MPTATTAVSWVARSRLKFRASAAQLSTIRRSVAPAPQNSVVTASDTWPSGSRHSSLKLCQKSFSTDSGSLDGSLWSMASFGMYRLNSAAIA